MDITLTKIEYGDLEVHARFDLDANFDTQAFMQVLPRALLSGTVVFPASPGGPPQPDTERQAHEQLLEHLEAFAEELREILKR